MARRACIIGGGRIGGGWAARFALMGWDVSVFDPAPDARPRVEETLRRARRSLPGLSDSALPPEGALSFASTLAEAVRDAEWVQECVPERLDLKRAVIAAIDADCPRGAIVASSTRGFAPSQLLEGTVWPERILVAHPSDPVYLVPLVELAGAPRTSAETLDRAAAILTALGMAPLSMRSETARRSAERLLGALQDEALRLVREGVAGPQDIDDATRMGLGLHLAQTGVFETARRAGHDLDPAQGLPGSDPVPDPTPATPPVVTDRDETRTDDAAIRSDTRAGGPDPAATYAMRDDTLVTLLRGLKARGCGAGRVLTDLDLRLDGLPRRLEEADLGAPLPTADRTVPLDWTDYNDHMTEARYLHAFGEATDRLMMLIGCTQAYITAGKSFFTAETHIRHLDEVRAGTRIRIDTQMLAGAGRKMHIFHRMRAGERLLATSEHMMIHVDLCTRRACAPLDEVAGPLGRLAQAHAALPWPEGVGRSVGRK